MREQRKGGTRVEAQTGWRSFVSVGSLVSGLLTVAVWGLQFPWVTGVYLVLLLYAHEIGHVVAARWRGLPVLQPPVFIPGMGAFVMVGVAARPLDGVLMSLGGPIVGGAAALAAKLAGVALGNVGLAFVADFCLLVNLINLVPATPFDGGRALQPVGGVGLILAATMAIVASRTGNLFLIGLALFALLQQGYRMMSARGRVETGLAITAAIGALYAAAVAALFAAYMLTPRVPWLLAAVHPWQPAMSALLWVLVGAYLLSRAVWKHAWSPGRGARVRYLILALLGWPQWLVNDPWFILPAWCGLAHVAGLPGLRWLNQAVRYLAARGRRPAGFGVAVGYDCLLQQGDREAAAAWLEELGPACQAGGLWVMQAGFGDLNLMGYHATAVSWLLPDADGRHNPGSVPAAAANNLAWVLLMDGRPNEAMLYARAAVEREPGRAPYLDTLGRILVEAGDSAGAETALRKSLHLEPHPGTHTALARALAGQQRFREAAAEAERALSRYSHPWPADDPQPAEVRRWVIEWRMEATQPGEA